MLHILINTTSGRPVYKKVRPDGPEKIVASKSREVVEHHFDNHPIRGMVQIVSVDTQDLARLIEML